MKELTSQGPSIAQPPIPPANGEQKETLMEISGKGTCLGAVPKSHQHLCNQTLPSPQAGVNYYLIPPTDGWWACSTSLTPCVSTSVFNTSKDYCALVRLLPHVIYHDAPSFEDEFDPRLKRYKREPVSITLVVLLGLGVAARVGTRTAALVQTPQYFEGAAGHYGQRSQNNRTVHHKIRVIVNLFVKSHAAELEGVRFTVPQGWGYLCSLKRRMLLLCRPFWSS